MASPKASGPTRDRSFGLYLSGPAAVLLISLSISCSSNPDESPPPGDPTLNPIYQAYNFSHDPDTIDIGVQPLWLPTGIISEVMRRDLILRESLGKQGLVIQFHDFLKGADINAFIERGDLDAGIVGDMPALSAASSLNVLVAALIQQGFCSIVTRKQMLVKDLRHKRIGYAFGSNAHHALLWALEGAGLSEADITLVPLDVSEMPDALQKGQIDAYSAWEPTPSISLAIDNNAVISHRSTTTGYLYFSSALAEVSPVAVRSIVASEIRAMRWLWQGFDNLRTASAWAMRSAELLSGKTSILNIDTYIGLAKDDLLGISPAPVIPASSLDRGSNLHREFLFLKDLEIIPGTVEWESVVSRFDRSIVREILDDPGTWEINRNEYAE